MLVIKIAEALLHKGTPLLARRKSLYKTSFFFGGRLLGSTVFVYTFYLYRLTLYLCNLFVHV